MAYTEKLLEPTLIGIAGEIGKNIFGLINRETFKGSKIQMTETFPLWILNTDAIAEAVKNRQDLRQIAEAAGLWHHQIKIDEQAMAFARTEQSEEDRDSWSLSEISASSELAGKIDKAIDWVDVDENTTGDPLVRLLFVPSYHVHAFWLSVEDSDNSQVLVIDVPIEHTNFKSDRLYDSDEFLKQLLDEPLILGIQYDEKPGV